MINNYFRQPTRPSIQITYQPRTYTPLQPQPTPRQRKYKMLIGLLVRGVGRVLREGFGAVQGRGRQVAGLVGRMGSIAEKNNGMLVWMAMNRLKMHWQAEKNHEKVFKSLGTLLGRMERYKMQQCFHKLAVHSARGSTALIDSFIQQRRHIFARKIQTVVRRKKAMVIGQLKTWSQFVKGYSRLRIVLTVHDRYAKYLKRVFFSRAQRLLFKR